LLTVLNRDAATNSLPFVFAYSDRYMKEGPRQPQRKKSNEREKKWIRDNIPSRCS